MTNTGSKKDLENSGEMLQEKSPEDDRKTSTFWDRNVKLHEKPAPPVSWLDAPVVMQHCLKKLKAGDDVINVIQWLLWVKRKLVPSTTLDFGLSLGCGDGTLERHSLSLNICSRFDAVDISSNSIEIAKKQSEEKGFGDRINYQVADLNNIVLEHNKYDIIFSGMALHHLHNFDHIFTELRKSLKPEGFFVLIEFVGPSRFQWTDQQLRIINEILSLLPERLKIDIRSGARKECCLRPSVQSMIELDPSEAVRSSDIIPSVYRMWDVIEHINFGGTISHMLLDGIVANFDPAREEDVAILKLIEYIEDVLIRENVLNSDFTLIVAKKSSEAGRCEESIEGQRYSVPAHNKAEDINGLFKKLIVNLKGKGVLYTTKKVITFLKRQF